MTTPVSKPVVTIDGNLSDWVSSERIDYYDNPGYSLYAVQQGGFFDFALSAPVQIDSGHSVGVIPTGPRRPRNKLIAVAAMRRNHGRAFLLGAIHFGRDQQPVEVHQFRNVGLVHHIDRYRNSLFHS